MGIVSIINEVLVLFFIIIIGYFAKKYNIINHEANKKITELLLKITTPCMLVSSFQFDFSLKMLFNAMIFFLCALGILVFSVFVGEIIFNRFPLGKKSVLKHVTVFSNNTFMGFPVLEAFYGKIGVFYGSVFLIPNNLLLWTYGVFVFNEKKDIKSMKKALLNPGFIAVIIGFLLFILSIELPYPVLKTLETVGSITSPLAMVIIGASLADLDFKSIFSWSQAYYGIVLRIIIIPLVAFSALKLLGIEGDLMSILVLLTAMPAAAITALFANMYGGDISFASRSIGISTILSVFTLSLFVLLIQGGT
jgi:predicted permease